MSAVAGWTLSGFETSSFSPCPRVWRYCQRKDEFSTSIAPMNEILRQKRFEVIGKTAGKSAKAPATADLGHPRIFLSDARATLVKIHGDTVLMAITRHFDSEGHVRHMILTLSNLSYLQAFGPPTHCYCTNF
jgi:hypothetical protein